MFEIPGVSNAVNTTEETNSGPVLEAFESDPEEFRWSEDHEQ
jgi:hypothetical protein